MKLMDHTVMTCLFSLFLVTVSPADPPSNEATSASPMIPANQLSNTSTATYNVPQTNTTSSSVDPSSNTSSSLSEDTSSSVTTSSCTTRRCLANMLIEKEALSQPQSSKCISNISVPLIVYETLSVDIKNLRFQSRLQITLSWEDPDLSWETLVYEHDTVVLPVRKIWTPQFHVINGVETTTEPGNQDLLVYRNGTIEHSVIMNTVVDCQVNLYKYPFISDGCAIAINGWASGECGVSLNFGNVTPINANSGDWITESVNLNANNPEHSYLLVSLKMRSNNLLLSLVLPSILILLADIVSYALPLGGGERTGFRITLVLSFVMFLIILTNLLPSGGQCSPIIQYHFAFCLIILVSSTLQSMVLTRIAKCGTLLPCSLSKPGELPLKDTVTEQSGDEGTHLHNSIICCHIDARQPVSLDSKCEANLKLEASEKEENTTLQKVVKFLDKMAAEDQKKVRHSSFASKLDLICFCTQLIISIVYTIAVSYLYFGPQCIIDPLDFWD
ncbi:zinc-activated ligand-gated ion channel-like isoform X2 [Esox lucius]|uniref:zinc-activated ligand-gated ion channel-like isoform X2 n=1 Tax=Esox lucius TaxID=8010 RepID=UPI001476CB96|nr:zinc-activated ligand-gated ion channel-like isoform X2 [Esox lucius]